VVVEPVSDLVARLAGVALTRVPSAQTIDAIVMASASQRVGEIVYTSDAGGLELLRASVAQFNLVRIQTA
jgi:hypothetical protein